MVKKEKLTNAEKTFSTIAAKLEAVADFPRQRALKKKEQRKMEVPYATFNDRVFASVIDTGISFVLLGPILIAMSNTIYGNARTNIAATLPQTASMGEMLAHLNNINFLNNMLVDYLLHFVVFGVIILWLWQTSSSTPGKWLLKMRVVDANTFRPTPKQLMIRYAGYAVSMLPLTLGFAWIMVDKRNRAWHDIMADTVVVKVKHWRFKDDGKTPHITVPVAAKDVPEEEDDNTI